MSTNSFKIKNSAVLTPKDLSTLVSPEAGEIACDINDSNKIKRYDAASSSWVEVGSGGVGSVDIMFVQDFESASLSSFTQTGLSLSTTNPLHGKVSALLTHQAAINQSFKQVIPVDPKFRGQAMVLDLNVKSAASAGNVVIKVRDESNSSDLIVSEALQLSNDVSGRRSSVSFTIPSTCSSLSYTITALPEAGSPVTRIDDIVAMLSDVSLLETSVLVPNMTAWQGYTPTFQGFGTPSNVEFEWRQVGENVEIRGKFTAGTTTAVEARVGLPAGLTSAGTGLIPSIQAIGTYFIGVSTANDGGSVLISPSTNYINISSPAVFNSGTVNALLPALGSNVGTGDVVSFFASVPCAGLSATTTKTIPLTQSGLVQNADSAIRVSSLNGYGSTATRIRRFSTINENFGSDILYQDSAINGSSFTVLTSGIYNISYDDGFTTATYIGISKNATSLSTSISALSNNERIALSYQDAINNPCSISCTVYLNAGDVIRPHTDGGTAVLAAFGSFKITKQGSLKQLNVSSDQKITIPTSELRFEGASARGTGTETGIVQFTSLAKLRGDAFTVDNSNGTAITMKKAGKLEVNSSLVLPTAGSVIQITKNQSVRTSGPTANEVLSSDQAYTNISVVHCAASTFVNVGDIIRIYASGTPSANAANNLNLSFQEQDISVSVTNTLPQFSESDSSVRVDTANGYGSTGTKIRRFSNIRDNIGADIEYVPSAVNGDSFVVKSTGLYSISYTDILNSASNIGISKNASSLTTNIVALPIAERLLIGTTSATDFSETASIEAYLVAGDVIRAHTNGTATGSVPALAQFTISKVGKPNVTGVDVTPFVNVPQPDVENARLINTSNTTSSGALVTGSLTSFSNKGVISYNSTTGVYTFLKPAKVNASFSLQSSGAVKIDTQIELDGVAVGRATNDSAVATSWASSTFNGQVQAGQTLQFRNQGSGSGAAVYTSVLATALSDQILTAPESFSTDTASLSYASSAAYTLSTLQNAPVGTYITFTYAANTNTRTQTTTRPTQTDADMNVNGMLIYTRAYNVASTAAQPAAFAMQIGKGLKGRNLDLYKSAGKVTSGNLDFYILGSTNEYGIIYKDYNELTGILIIDIGVAFNGAPNTIKRLVFSDISEATSGYLVINASKSPALTGVPQLLPRIATLSDVKAANTAGGTATAGSYQTRTLNTLSDPTGIVTSLASNQFTLPAGEYYIEASAPGFSVDYHRAKIRNITDSSDVLLGTTEFSINSAFYATSSSKISGNIVISSPKVFELQHRVTFTRATNGFGGAANIGDNELFSIVKITKVK